MRDGALSFLQPDRFTLHLLRITRWKERIVVLALPISELNALPGITLAVMSPVF
jgi:hypothetical protein